MEIFTWFNVEKIQNINNEEFSPPYLWPVFTQCWPCTQLICLFYLPGHSMHSKETLYFLSFSIVYTNLHVISPSHISVSWRLFYISKEIFVLLHDCIISHLWMYRSTTASLKPLGYECIWSLLYKDNLCIYYI